MSELDLEPAYDSSQDAWSVAWRQLRRNRLAVIGMITIMLLFGVAAFAPILANGRPLYLRGHMTALYENDVAAFRDWHARLLETAAALGSPMPKDQRLSGEEKLALYRAGLPDILSRLQDALDPARVEQLGQAAEEYGRLLDAPQLDLPALAELGDSIEASFCRLSLLPCYKLTATPLLDVSDLSEALSQAQAATVAALTSADRAAADANLERQTVRAQALAQRVEDGAAALLRFVSLSERAAIAETTARAVAQLRSPDDTRQLRLTSRELADALDQVAASPVEPGGQLLPVHTRWPVLATLTPLEVAAIAAYLTALLAALGAAFVMSLGPKARLTLLLGPTLLASVGWAALVPQREPLADSLYKALARQASQQPEGQTVIVFPPVPFGENENEYADRQTPPLLWELFELDRWERRQGAESDDPAPSLLRRLREPGEPPLDAAGARARLTRLRAHLLGTDANGRDTLARLIVGGRVSLSVGFVAVSIYVLIGVVLGAFAGYFGGWVDLVISRFTEIVICFPAFFLIITVMAVLDRPSIFNIMIVIGITRWTEVMRLVRGEFLRLVNQDFVVAGRALGLSPMRVVFRHVLPNALGPVFVATAFGVAGAILIESALSYLGFGVPQPQASWGSVLHEAKGHEQAMWWLTIFPGLLIFVTITAYNIVGEGLRDALDPRLRQ